MEIDFRPVVIDLLRGVVPLAWLGSPRLHVWRVSGVCVVCVL